MLGKPKRPTSTASPQQRLLNIARALPDKMDGVLEAALGGLTEHQLVEEGRRSRPEEVVEDAAELYAQAWAFFAHAGPGAAGLVRGCSRQLICLAARSALQLAELDEKQRTEVRTHGVRKDAARGAVTLAFERAVKLRDQARSVLGRVVGSDPVRRAEVDRAATTEDQRSSLPAALSALAAVGRRIIDEQWGSPVQLSMYGLDEAYLQELEDAGANLTKAEANFDKILSKDGTPQVELQRLMGVNVKLMLQILDAFLSAHELDTSVPLLTPRHHESLLQQISRLPPPPSPGVLALKSPKAEPTTAKAQELPTPKGLIAPNRVIIRRK